MLCVVRKPLMFLLRSLRFEAVFMLISTRIQFLDKGISQVLFIFWEELSDLQGRLTTVAHGLLKICNRDIKMHPARIKNLFLI